MNPRPTPNPREVVQLLIAYRKRWLIPAAVIGLAALAYAVLRPATWEVSQALIVRNDAINNQLGPGKFSDTDEMKTVQETILELAKSQGVLSAALTTVGPPARFDADAWPTDRAIDELRKNLKLTPPKGAEFGKTEVFYLQVQDTDRERAIALSAAICGQLESRFQQLRDTKAQSMIDELVRTVGLDKAALDESTARLTAIETEVGGDLGELRALNEPGTSESVLRRSMTEIRNELRQIGSSRKALQELLALLSEAQDDPGRVLATPNSLLDSQPALRRLKEGLIDAQLKTATLQGSMSAAHPRVEAARQAEEEIGRHLHDELAIALRGVKVELQMNGDRQALLEDQLAQANGRLNRLAELRATYANQLAETRSRNALVERAEQQLADARATRAAAKATSLISRIDAPDAGINPIGPSRAMIVLAGIAGGLLTGLGLVFLTVPTTQPATRAAAAVPAEQPLTSAPAAEPVAKPARPLLQPIKGLSLRQALEKIVYGSKT